MRIGKDLREFIELLNAKGVEHHLRTEILGRPGAASRRLQAAGSRLFQKPRRLLLKLNPLADARGSETQSADTGPRPQGAGCALMADSAAAKTWHPAHSADPGVRSPIFGSNY
jgi:hypothetical protein